MTQKVKASELKVGDKILVEAEVTKLAEGTGHPAGLSMPGYSNNTWLFRDIEVTLVERPFEIRDELGFMFKTEYGSTWMCLGGGLAVRVKHSNGKPITNIYPTLPLTTIPGPFSAAD